MAQQHISFDSFTRESNVNVDEMIDQVLVEFDEEPPHKINDEAFDITLQVAKMLNAQVVDEIQVMRKTVVDGSNASIAMGQYSIGATLGIKF